jgi:hypothetical protein
VRRRCGAPAAFKGRGGGVRALLENGADPTIANHDNDDGTTPMAVAKEVPQQDEDTPGDERISAEGRRECVAVLEVRPLSVFLSFCSCTLLGCWEGEEARVSPPKHPQQQRATVEEHFELPLMAEA